MQQKLVHPGMEAVTAGFRNNRRTGHFVGQHAPFRQGNVWPRVWMRNRHIACRGNRQPKFGKPATTHGNGGDDRDAQRRFQRGRVDGEPVPLRKIDHVERNHGRSAQFDHFLCEDEVLFEVGRIKHDDQYVGPDLPFLLTHNDPAGHFLIGAGGGKRIRARQVDQFNRFATGKDQPPCFPFDGYARIIGDFLSRAGQRIEKGAFPGVRIADKRGNGWLAGHAAMPPLRDAGSTCSTCIARAWTRRRATVIRPTSTASGSLPPNTPR